MLHRFFALALGFVLLIAAGCKTNPPAENRAVDVSQPATEASREPSAPPAPKPSLSGKIQNLSLYPVPNKREDLAVSLVVSVVNSGAPGFAQDWKLDLNSPVREGLKGLEPVHVNGIVEIPGSQKMRVDLAKEDLAIKSKQSPISKGDQLDGILTFVLPKTSAADLSNNKTSFVLHFKDSQGSSYQTPKSVIGAKIAR